MTTDLLNNRTARLLGEEAVHRLGQQRVILFGVGGVGSWCAESLVRTGIRHLTIVDPDCVAPSNVNRQLMATSQTLGQVKVQVLRDRLLAINPEAEITALQQSYTAETASSFALGEYDYVIDAIDSLQDKAHLILEACRARRPRLFASMGAALKLDPTRISVAEFWKVKGCPLAAALRRRFKQRKELPSRKFKCVFSDELLENRGETSEDPGTKARINGSLSHITGIFGFTLAGLVIEDVMRKVEEESTQA